MTTVFMTQHAHCRKQQRGYHNSDIPFLLQHGTQVASDTYMLTQSDAARIAKRLKCEVQRIERLIGSIIIMVGSTVITMYHASRSEQKRRMRAAREFQ